MIVSDKIKQNRPTDREIAANNTQKTKFIAADEGAGGDGEEGNRWIEELTAGGSV